MSPSSFAMERMRLNEHRPDTWTATSRMIDLTGSFCLPPMPCFQPLDELPDAARRQLRLAGQRRRAEPRKLRVIMQKFDRPLCSGIREGVCIGLHDRSGRRSIQQKVSTPMPSGRSKMRFRCCSR